MVYSPLMVFAERYAALLSWLSGASTAFVQQYAYQQKHYFIFDTNMPGLENTPQQHGRRLAFLKIHRQLNQLQPTGDLAAGTGLSGGMQRRMTRDTPKP